MTDLDLERLGDVWRQRPDPKELEELKRTAERVRRRARWLQVIDVVAAIVVAGVVLFLVLSNPQLETLLVGGGAILVLLIGQIRSRRFRQKELGSLTGSTEQMLDQSIERVRATLGRARSGLILLPLAILLGYFVAYVASRSESEIATRIAAQPGLADLIRIAAGLATVVALVMIIRSLRSCRRELGRLTALRDSYRQEQESSRTE
jgi:hypothetical protein